MRQSLFVLIFLVAFVVTTASQAGNTQAAEAPFSVSIAGAAEVEFRDAIELRVRFKNTSNHDLTMSVLYVEGVDFTLNYKVRDAEGNFCRKERKKIEIDGSFKTITLKPGETEQESTLLSRIFDLPTGVYTIQLARPIPDNQKGSFRSSAKPF